MFIIVKEETFLWPLAIYQPQIYLLLTVTRVAFSKQRILKLYLCSLLGFLDKRFYCVGPIWKTYFGWINQINSSGHSVWNKLKIFHLLQRVIVRSIYVPFAYHLWNVSLCCGKWHLLIFQPNAEELERRVEELRHHYQEARMKARGTSGCGAGGTGAQSGNNTPGGGSNSPTSPHSRSRHGSPTRSSKDKHHNSGSPRWGGGFIRQGISFIWMWVNAVNAMDWWKWFMFCSMLQSK
jgi:hypothetical protein